MDHCDGIIFTAGVGENSISTRERVAGGLASLGIKIDRDKNDMRGKEAVISADDSSIPVLVIPTNEELKIAMETAKLV